MANTIPDIILDNVSYQDVNQLSGVPVGTKVLLQFKGSGNVRVQLKPFQPASSSTDGLQLISFEMYMVDQGESIIWVKGSGRLCVQVI